MYPDLLSAYPSMTWERVLETPFDLLWKLIDRLALTPEQREVVAYALFD